MMWRPALIVLLFLILLVFASLNMHTTRVNVPFTKGLEMRTVFLLILCFFLGYGTSYFVGLAKALKSRKRNGLEHDE